MKCKNHSDLVFLQAAVTSKRMIGKGPGWSHSLHLFKISLDFIHKELRSNNIKYKIKRFFMSSVVEEGEARMQ
jgi:hypothetical protein